MEDINRKIDNLEKKIDHIENLLEILISQKDETIVLPIKEEIVEPLTEVTPEPVVETPVVMETSPEVETSLQVETLPEETIEEPKKQPQPVVKPVVKAPKKKSDLETFIGKNVFVILASVLIFIGVIFFAKVLLPYITEEVKFAFMGIFSIGFTLFSYRLVRQKATSWSISLLACGLGTIYITLFTGNLYFKFINDVLLYIALLFWIMIVYYCSRYKTWLFNTIGQAGILIALMLCLYQAVMQFDQRLFIFVLVYTVTAEILYDQLFKNSVINNVGMIIALWILAIPVFQVIEPSTSYLSFRISQITLQELFVSYSSKLIPIGIWLLCFGYALIKNLMINRHNQIQFTIVNGIGVFMFMTVCGYFQSTTGLLLIELCFCATMLLLAEWMFRQEEHLLLTKVLSCILLTLILIIYCSLFDYLWVPAMLLLLPLALWQSVQKDNRWPKEFFIYGIVLTTLINFIFSLFPSSRFINYSQKMVEPRNVVYYICCLLCVACYYLLLQTKEKTDKKKLFLYLFVLVNVYLQFTNRNNMSYSMPLYEESRLLNMMLAVGIQVFFGIIHPLFRREVPIFKQNNFKVYFVVNCWMMISAVTNLYILDNSSTIYYLMAVLLTIVLFTLNTSVFLVEPNEKWSIYVGVKITILIFIVMHAYDVAPLVSIMLFLWAVVCIILGQQYRRRDLRVYALLLSLISAVKLILIDITYSSSLSRAFSFIICGGLCFLISYIYTQIEKRNKLERENHNLSED